MTESNQTSTVPLSVSKEKIQKKFYEHGRDALELALSIANIQEEKALRKVEKHHQPQVGKSRTERKNWDHANNKRKRLEDAKIMIAKRRADAKREKKSRKQSKGRLRQCHHDAKIIAPEIATTAAPRKRVSFV